MMGAMTDGDAFEALYARGVTDGLPVIPPTAERVAAAVAASGRPADELVGLVAPQHGRATVQRIAINAVMAGCRPEYLPVVIAGVRAICDPAFALEGVSGTTDAVAPLLIVNGPVRHALDINAGVGVFGPGWRANATIGRAVRLVWANVGGARPGAISMSTFGQSGRTPTASASTRRRARGPRCTSSKVSHPARARWPRWPPRRRRWSWTRA